MQVGVTCCYNQLARCAFDDDERLAAFRPKIDLMNLKSNVQSSGKKIIQREEPLQERAFVRIILKSFKRIVVTRYFPDRLLLRGGRDQECRVRQRETIPLCLPSPVLSFYKEQGGDP